MEGIIDNASTQRAGLQSTVSAEVSQGDRLAEAGTSIDGVGSQFLLDTQDLVELGQTLRSCWSTRLDLTSSNTNHDVGNRDILSLTRAVRDHDSPSSSVRVFGGLNGFRQGADLVDFQEQSIAGLRLNSSLDALGVGHSQVIAFHIVSVCSIHSTRRKAYPTIWKSEVLKK